MDTEKEKVRCPYCGHPVNANSITNTMHSAVHVFFICHPSLLSVSLYELFYVLNII